MFAVGDEVVVGINCAKEGKEDLDVGVDVFLQFLRESSVGGEFFFRIDVTNTSEGVAGGGEHVFSVLSFEAGTFEFANNTFFDQTVGVEEEANGEVGVALGGMDGGGFELLDVGLDFNRRGVVEEAVSAVFGNHGRRSSVSVDAGPALIFKGNVDGGVGWFGRSCTESVGTCVSVERSGRLSGGRRCFTMTTAAADESFAVSSVEEGAKHKVGRLFGESGIVGGGDSNHLSGGRVFATHREAAADESGVLLAIFSRHCLDREVSDRANVLEGEGVGD